MPEQMITASAVKVWDDGNISVRDHTGRYIKAGQYCQNKEGLPAMEGQAIIADIVSKQYDSGTKHFMNSWRPADGRQPLTGQPSVPPPVIVPVPPAQTPLHVPPPPPRDDRQNSIIAQTLCKTVTFASVQDALAGYQWLLEALSGEIVVDTAGIVDEQVMGAIMDARPDPVAHAGEPAFDDDIPGW